MTARRTRLTTKNPGSTSRHGAQIARLPLQLGGAESLNRNPDDNIKEHAMKLPLTLALAALIGTGPTFADPRARSRLLQEASGR